jgi:hypothetical protein
MGLYVPRVSPIEATYLSENTVDEIVRWTNGRIGADYITINNPNGNVVEARYGDYILKDEIGNFSVMTAQAFYKNYYPLGIGALHAFSW